jgi:hypothetical protein
LAERKIKMKRIKVKSSSIGYLGYDARKQILEVIFNNGRGYKYYELPKTLYMQLLNASSKGRFFNKYIREGGFKFEKFA